MKARAVGQQAEREENPLGTESRPVVAGHMWPGQSRWSNALPAARAGDGLDAAQQQFAGGNSYPHRPGREAGAEMVGSSPVAQPAQPPCPLEQDRLAPGTQQFRS